jgi:dienelactone hydrolase
MNRRDALMTPLALTIPSLAADPEPAAPGADVGNLHEFLAWAAAKQRMGLSFLDPRWKSLEDWKRAARPFHNRLLGYAPPALPLSAETLGREERDGFTLETLRIRATGAYDIPGWFLLPSGRKGRVPGVIAIHCHGGCYTLGHEKILSVPGEHEYATAYRQRAYGRPYVEFLARRGFAVLAIDGFYFGRRRLRVEDLDPATLPSYVAQPVAKVKASQPGSSEWYSAVDRACGEYENLVAKTIFTAGATWPGILAWDDMRSVDYLASRPEVDPKRIGCVGLSIGGLRTARLAAADERIKAACVVGWMTEFRAQLRNHLRHHTWMLYVPGLNGEMDLPDATAMMAPGALMVQQCSRDQLYPMQGMKGAVGKLEKIYAKAGLPDRFRGLFYDVPHSFTPAMQEDAFAWFEKWL